MCIVLIETLTGNLSIVGVTYKASWMRTFGRGAYWEGAMLAVARDEDLMLRRRRASEFGGHTEEIRNVQYGLRVANASNHDQNLQCYADLSVVRSLQALHMRGSIIDDDVAASQSPLHMQSRDEASNIHRHDTLRCDDRCSASSYISHCVVYKEILSSQYPSHVVRIHSDPMRPLTI